MINKIKKYNKFPYTESQSFLEDISSSCSVSYTIHLLNAGFLFTDGINDYVDIAWRIEDYTVSKLWSDYYMCKMKI